MKKYGPRTFYFDIDGVLLNHPYIKDGEPIDFEQRPLLAENTALQDRLKILGFERFICVSNWTDIEKTVDKHLPRSLKKTEKEVEEKIYLMINQIFPDKIWFMPLLKLKYKNEYRCDHIDLSNDWFYIDDLADLHFPKCHGKKLYDKELGRRILLVDPEGDGQDILDWLDETVKNII